MKELLVLVVLFGFARAASAALPFEVEVIDFEPDGDIDEEDIQTAIGMCAPLDSSGGGCTIVLPRDTISLGETLVLGDGGSGNNPTGLIFRGQGSCSRGVTPPAASMGSVLRWDGDPDGTMIDIQEAHRLRFENLCLVLDPEMVAGGSAARYGVRFSGDKPLGHTTQGTVFQNVGIWGPVGTPPAGMTAVYITATGSPMSAQLTYPPL